MSVCELYNEVVRDLLNHANEVNIAAYGDNRLSEVEVMGVCEV